MEPRMINPAFAVVKGTDIFGMKNIGTRNMRAWII
jgi:hypothetical protein